MNQIYVLVRNDDGKLSLCFTDNVVKDSEGEECQVQYDTDYGRIVKAKDNLNELYKTDTREYFVSVLTPPEQPKDADLKDDIINALANYRLVQKALNDHVGVKLTSSLIERAKFHLTKYFHSV